MQTAYVRRLILGYLANIAARVRHRSPEAKQLVMWVLDSADILDLPGYAENLGLRGKARRAGTVSAEDWRRLLDILASERKASKWVRGDLTARRVRSLGRNMGLSTTDIALLEFALRYDTQPGVTSLGDEILCHHGFNARYGRCLSVANVGLAHLLGISPGTLLRRLAYDSPLAQSGLVFVDDDGDFELLPRLSRLAHEPASGGTDIQQLLFDEAPAAELEWQDFDHLADGRDHVEHLIAGALESRQRGVNVLFYGPPGTGKTQFCRTLAQRLGVTLYSVGEADERGWEPNRGERLQELRLTQRVLGGCRDAILLFDEMEDLLSPPGSMFPWFPDATRRGGRRSDGSKVFMNRLLENTRVPILWTTNAARQTCPTVLRRMMYALELRQPSPRVRARIWTRQLQRHGIPSVESDARALARDFTSWFSTRPTRCFPTGAARTAVGRSAKSTRCSRGWKATRCRLRAPPISASVSIPRRCGASTSSSA